MNPAPILKSMYPEKFSELAGIVRGFAPGADDGAVEDAAGELLVGLGQCGSESDVAELAARVFKNTLEMDLTPGEAEEAGASIYRWRRGWTDVLF